MREFLVHIPYKRFNFANFLRNETAFLWIHNLLISKEKTPKWLDNKEQQNKNTDEELDPDFEKEVKAFKQKLSKDWPEE